MMSFLGSTTEALNIDWDQERASHLLLNDRWPQSVREGLTKWTQQVRQEWPGLIWLATSGTTGRSGYRLVGLSRQALLSSALAVNRHLQVLQSDHWFCPLPLFHVGGLAILARSFQAGLAAPAIWNEAWDPQEFCLALGDSRATLASLVPTQVYDLVSKGLKAPSVLRALVVGGGALSPFLYQRARELNWPLLPSYGMTECSSQVATALLSSLDRPAQDFAEDLPELRRLEHIQWATDVGSQVLRIKSPSLLTAVIEVDLRNPGAFAYDPKQEGWFQTEDIVSLEGENSLRFIGRVGETLKVSGELVNLHFLNSRLQEMIMERDPSRIQSLVVVARACPRRGHNMILLAEKDVPLQWVEDLRQTYDQSVFPYERMTAVEWVDKIPRNSMGKVQWGR